MSINATQYNIVFPLAKKSTYEANDTVDFVLSLENKKLVQAVLQSVATPQSLKIKVQVPHLPHRIPMVTLTLTLVTMLYLEISQLNLEVLV